MKTYSVIFAHLRQPSGLQVQDRVEEGFPIGVMGNTGVSQGDHLHFTCVEGLQAAPWTLEAMEEFSPKPALRQAGYFLDKGLFGIEALITTAWNCPLYLRKWKKVHNAFDVVPSDRWVNDSHYQIWWNRTKRGTVTYSGFDPAYGYCVIISFEA